MCLVSPRPWRWGCARLGSFSGAVAFTEGILRALSADELAGVTAHELAHIKHRDILTSSIAATLGSAITLLARSFQLIIGVLALNAAYIAATGHELRELFL